MTEPSGQHATAEELYCPNCGYDLRGLGAGECPECGERFNPVELRRTQIPWCYRGQIGWLRTYWRTVWMVMFRNAVFCREAARPVSFRDARLFQWVSIAHAYVGVLMVTAGLYVNQQHTGDSPLAWALTHVWPVALAHVLIVLFILAVTGVHTYWFHPRHLSVIKQNRAVALAYYCCAPLALVPAGVVGGVGLVVLINLWDHVTPLSTMALVGHVLISTIALVAMLLVTLFPLAQLWLLPVRMVRRTAERGTMGQAMLAVALPLLWLLLAVVILVLLPVICIWLWLVWASLVS